MKYSFKKYKTYKLDKNYKKYSSNTNIQNKESNRKYYDKCKKSIKIGFINEITTPIRVTYQKNLYYELLEKEFEEFTKF
jgi:hypothetical protein